MNLPNRTLILSLLSDVDQKQPKVTFPFFISEEDLLNLKQRITRDLNSIMAGEKPSNIVPYGKKGQCIRYDLGSYSSIQTCDSIVDWLKENGYESYCESLPFRGINSRYGVHFVLILSP